MRCAISNDIWQKLVSYYLDALRNERDKSVQFLINQEISDNLFIQTDSHLLSVSAGKKPEVLNFIKNRPTYLNANLYLGYPTFLTIDDDRKQKNIMPLFLFTLDESGKTDHLSSARLNYEVFKKLGMASEDITEDLQRLNEELGMNAEDADLSIKNLTSILMTKFPNWPWQDALSFEQMSEKPFSSIETGGFYNSAIIFWGESSKFVQGLEGELKDLKKIGIEASPILKSLLQRKSDEIKSENLKHRIYSTVSLNPQQRDAVEQALTNRVTVITGPPGTGKSQVVSAILTNAALQNQTVLFSSKNHKAVDVVIDRVNSLTKTPFLLKLSSPKQSEDTKERILDLLEGRKYPKNSSSETISRQADTLIDEIRNVQKNIQEHWDAIQKIEQLKTNISNIRKQLSDNLHKFVSDAELPSQLIFIFQSKNTLSLLKNELTILRKKSNPTEQNVIEKILWLFTKKSKKEKLVKSLNNCSNILKNKETSLDIQINTIIETASITINKINETLEQLILLEEYLNAVDSLKKVSLPQETLRLSQLEQQLHETDLLYWQDYWESLASNLSDENFLALSRYVQLLELASVDFDRSVSQKLNALSKVISKILPAWAVTSLSVRGRCPLEPEYYDVLILDEASQCDIPSALPLIFRAKKIVVIGDQKQLRHITNLSLKSDKDLLKKHSLFEDHLEWMYSSKSIFDLVCNLPGAQIVNLKEHHRSHQDIISFSNKEFYNSQLLVATSYDKLVKNENLPPLVWKHISGAVEAPANSGSINVIEAAAVHQFLKEMITHPNFNGSVGITTPFRKQANKIRQLVEQDSELSTLIPKHDLIIDTVHKFQGDERDVIIFSPVVSRNISQSSLNFLKNQGNVFNVAVTRARSSLVTIGDLDICKSSSVEFLRSFAEHNETVSMRNSQHKHIQPLMKDPKISNWEMIFHKALQDRGILAMQQYLEDKYALDFAIIKENGKKLNIEIDGEAFHKEWTGQKKREDVLRNQTLANLGWDVRRFWVYQIDENLNECVNTVEDWLGHFD